MSNCTNCENPYTNPPFNVNQPYGINNEGQVTSVFSDNGGTPYTPLFNPALRMSTTGYCCNCRSRYISWNQHLGVCTARINIPAKSTDDRDLNKNLAPYNAGFTVTDLPINPNLPTSWGGTTELVPIGSPTIDNSGKTPALKVENRTFTQTINLTDASTKDLKDQSSAYNLAGVAGFSITQNSIANGTSNPPGNFQSPGNYSNFSIGNACS